MAAYGIFDLREVTDMDKMEEYRRGVSQTVEEYGGRYIVLGGDPQVIEGDWEPRFLVLIEFPSVAQARLWYDSPEYRDLKALRRAAAKGDAILVTGVS
jgi:uncharacterized protein (DUF1330 family)